jgi:uncharacterized protein (DUF1501 family)
MKRHDSIADSLRGTAGEHSGSYVTRRDWLAGAATAGVFMVCAGGSRLALASPAPLARAGTQANDRRLVVVMLRGALDGLAAVAAVGDANWSTLRPTANDVATERLGALLPLDGTFALHPQLSTLHGWYRDGQLAVVHAVASPYRERSHFDAQQVLESGGDRAFALDTGWLARAMQVTDRRGVALAPALPLALRGAIQASSWAPSTQREPADDLLERIARVYEQDEPLRHAFEQARELHGSAAMAAMGAAAGAPGNGLAALAGEAGRMLAAVDGPTLAWIDSTGWDTHTQQGPRLARQLAGLDQSLGALRTALGERWSKTVVLVMTEFGRSVALNGSGGTDHGTGGVAFVAGGEVAGGRVIADWPGLARHQLLDGRDLRPTTDLRSLWKPVLQRQFGMASDDIDRVVLPGSPRPLAGLWRT